MRVVNEITGKMVYLDGTKSRLARMRRRVGAWAELFLSIFDESKMRMVMITLTYAPEHTWSKNHIRDYLRVLRRHIPKDHLFAYAWVAELQARQEIHYHLYLVVTQGTDVPRPDDSGMWPFGSSRIETGKTPYYLMKYTSKEHQKEFDLFPKRIRVFAVWVKRSWAEEILDQHLWSKYLWSTLPLWLFEQMMSFPGYLGYKPSPRDEGGWEIVIPPNRDIFKWADKDGKIIFDSPWKVPEIDRRG